MQFSSALALTLWQIGRHWLAGNFFFLCQRIFISSFSEPLGINIEGLNSLLFGIQLFIQIWFDGLWAALLDVAIKSILQVV